jgi:succinate dehydrogenase/fumarate reductase flavoprotein subunit
LLSVEATGGCRASSVRLFRRGPARCKLWNSVLGWGPDVMTKVTAMKYPTARLSDYDAATEFDVVVIGAGAGGLAAALFAAIRGVRVIVIEKTSLVGGTTAYTAGTLWIPGTHLALEAGGPAADIDAAERYLDAAVGERSDRDQRRAFLHGGPEALEILAREPGMQFRVRPNHPDYMGELPDAALGWRPIEALTVNGAKVPGLAIMRQQTEEFTVFGGLMLEHSEIADFSKLAREPFNPKNWPTLVRAALVFAQHLVTRPLYGRATRLTMGNALIGRLMIALSQRRVPIMVDATVVDILTEADRVTGIIVEQDGDSRRLGVRDALISATGGFNRSANRRSELMPQVPMEWSPIAPGSTGQLHDHIEASGGYYGGLPDTAGFWAPVSLPPRSDGTKGVYSHFALDRAKPGFVVVDQDGLRYLNESLSYHRFGLAMQQRAGGKGMPSYLIGDSRAVKRFGIGAVRPGGWGIRRRLRDGYVVRESTIEGLAIKLGMDPDSLAATIEQFNRSAETGVDADLGRGTTAYERNLGDASHGPNPSLGPLTKGPFYAIRLYPGDIGAAKGFVTDINARVVKRDGSAINGLYAIGNDMQSIMGDRYPGPGVTLGPALVFGYLAVRHALASRSGPDSGHPSEPDTSMTPLSHKKAGTGADD